jgi:hypothetical protein
MKTTVKGNEDDMMENNDITLSNQSRHPAIGCVLDQ